LNCALGEAEVVPGCTDGLAQVSDLVGEGVQVGQGVLHVSIGDEHLDFTYAATVWPVEGLGRLESGPEPATLEDGKRDAGEDGTRRGSAR
jgi:hypothetical protein